MTKIKNLEMAKAIAENEKIVVKKSLFGETVVYQPTGSRVDVLLNEYAADMGDKLVRLLETPDDKLAKAVEQAKIEKAAIGNVRVEALLSRDQQFAAVQAFRFTDFRYHPACDLRYFEGASAALIARVLQ